MRTIRVYFPDALAVGGEYRLPDDVVAHVVKVLRLGTGAALELFNGDGDAYAALITELDKRGARVCVQSRLPERIIESPLHTVLLQGISRGDKMDYTLQKATELGISQIMPVLTERCGVQMDAERWQKKREHWQAVVRSACEQCGRNVVPAVDAVQKLEKIVDNLSTGLRLVLDPYGNATLKTIVMDKHVILLAGPEGGLSEQDLRIAKQLGFSGVKMGPRILRTETAALAALSLLQGLYGDLA